MAQVDCINKVFEYKLRPNKSFVAGCETVLNSCRALYNGLLEQRISNYKQGKSISWVEQAREVTELRAAMPEFAAIDRAIQTEVVKRLEKAYQAFFRRVKAQEAKAGFPRFRGKDRYNCFEYGVDPRHKPALTDNKVRIKGVGSCRLKLTRPLAGTVKRIRVVRKAAGWFVQFICELPQPETLAQTGESVGLDVGLEFFATLSTGETIANPRYGKNAQKTIAEAQRILARKKKGSNSRHKAKRTIAKAYAKIANQRKDFAHKQVNSLVSRFDVIAVEKLNIKGLAKSNLAKSIHDVAWTIFNNILAYKAAWAGREVIEVNPAYTSQDCSRCGHRQKLTLADRIYSCPSCGLTLNRDHNAAINIKSRGATLLAERLARRVLSAEVGEKLSPLTVTSRA